MIEARFSEADDPMPFEEHHDEVGPLLRQVVTPAPDDFKAGKNCMKKVMMIETIEYDDVETCEHTTVNVCAQTDQLDFDSTEVEECNEKFVKQCKITFEDVAVPAEVKRCNEEIRRDCNEQGEEVCTTEHEVVCETTYKEFEVEEDVVNCDVTEEYVCAEDDDNKCMNVPVKSCTTKKQLTTKVVPSEECNVVPREVCGPERCPIVKSEPTCITETKFVISKLKYPRAVLKLIKVDFSECDAEAEVRLPCNSSTNLYNENHFGAKNGARRSLRGPTEGNLQNGAYEPEEDHDPDGQVVVQ